jgi:hypothetical protein
MLHVKHLLTKTLVRRTRLENHGHKKDVMLSKVETSQNVTKLSTLIHSSNRVSRKLVCVSLVETALASVLLSLLMLKNVTGWVSKYTGEDLDYANFHVVGLVDINTATTQISMHLQSASTHQKQSNATKKTDVVKVLWLKVVDVPRDYMILVINVRRRSTYQQLAVYIQRQRQRHRRHRHRQLAPT